MSNSHLSTASVKRTGVRPQPWKCSSAAGEGRPKDRQLCSGTQTFRGALKNPKPSSCQSRPQSHKQLIDAGRGLETDIGQRRTRKHTACCCPYWTCGRLVSGWQKGCGKIQALKHGDDQGESKEGPSRPGTFGTDRAPTRKPRSGCASLPVMLNKGSKQSQSHQTAKTRAAHKKGKVSC